MLALEFEHAQLYAKSIQTDVSRLTLLPKKLNLAAISISLGQGLPKINQSSGLTKHCTSEQALAKDCSKFPSSLKYPLVSMNQNL